MSSTLFRIHYPTTVVLDIFLMDYSGMLDDNRANDLLLNLRKKWLRLIFFGYTMLFIILLPPIIAHNSFANIISVAWISMFYTYLFLKCAHMIIFEIKDEKLDLRRYINICEYVLFFAGVVICISNSHTDRKAIEDLIYVIVLMWGLHVCFFVLLLIIATIYECCNYNVYLKDFALNIFEYEIPVLQYVVLSMIMYASKRDDSSERLLSTSNNSNDVNYESFAP